MKKHFSKSRQSGQTMIEFLLVVMVILTLLFGFLQLGWALAWGHYIQYATFMSARAYMSAHASRGEQLENASLVLRSMVKSRDGDKDLLGNIAPPLTGDERDLKGGTEPVPGGFIGTHPYAQSNNMGSRLFSWAEGVQYNFEFRLFFVPLAKWVIGEGKQIKMGPRGEQNSITWNGRIGLASDSFLGREQSTAECKQYMSELSRTIPRGDGAEFVYDNGC